MCLTVDKKFKTRKEAREFHNKPLKAEKDIKVYKILNKFTNKSKFQQMEYKKGYIYQELTPFIEDVFTDIFFQYGIRYYALAINTGLHSYKTKEKAKMVKGKYDKIVIMYIPKDSLYFIGKDNEIVSNKLVWY